MARRVNTKFLVVFSVVVLGDPAYYSRFGYTHARAEKFESEYQSEALQALTWGDAPEAGRLVYASAFGSALAA